MRRNIWMAMTFNPQIHGRHTIRVPGFDYSDPGYYMITVCTQDRKRLFGRIRNGQMVLNGLGRIAGECIRDVAIHFRNVHVDEWIVMPDHVHIIFEIQNKRRGAACCAPTDNRKFGDMPPGSLPVIVRSFKSAVSKRIHTFAPDIRIWQRNYWERILRDEGELWWYRNYIRDNPRNWKR